MTIPDLRSFAPAAVVCLLAALPLSAQQARLQLGQLNGLAAKAAEVVDVTLDGSALKMASQFLEKDPGLKGVVQGLSGVYVKAFEFDQPGAYTPEDVASIRQQLQAPAWSRIVQVKSRKEGDVEVYVLGDGKGGSAGMVVLAAEPKELVVVNIVGNVDMARLGSLEGKMGIPRMGLGSRKGARKDGGK